MVLACVGALIMGDSLTAQRAGLLAVAGVAAAGSWQLWRSHGLRRRERAARAAVAEGAALLVSELRSGVTADQALARVAEEVEVYRPISRAAALGVDVPAALRTAAAGPGMEQLALIGAGWAVARRTGASLTSTLSQVTSSLRAQEATDRLVEGELASARATAKLVAVLPVAAWGIGSGAGGDPLGFLLGTGWGLVCLLLGLALTWGGIAWISALTAREG